MQHHNTLTNTHTHNTQKDARAHTHIHTNIHGNACGKSNVACAAVRLSSRQFAVISLGDYDFDFGKSVGGRKEGGGGRITCVQSVKLFCFVTLTLL